MSAVETLASSNGTDVQRYSDVELRVNRVFDGPARLVFKAWTTPELVMKWWAPASFGINLLACEIDGRKGGGYRYSFAVPGHDKPMDFFGKYLAFEPPSRIVWTNEEEADGSVTTVTFDERDGKTHLTISDVYPNKAALDAAIASGSIGGWPEQFDQLDILLSEGGVEA